MGIRRVDHLGRLCLPKAVRKILELERETPLSIVIDGADIVLQQYRPHCVFCFRPGALQIHEKLVCRSCLDGLAALAETEAS